MGELEGMRDCETGAGVFCFLSFFGGSGRFSGITDSLIYSRQVNLKEIVKLRMHNLSHLRIFSHFLTINEFFGEVKHNI